MQYREAPRQVIFLPDIKLEKIRMVGQAGDNEFRPLSGHNLALQAEFPAYP